MYQSPFFKEKLELFSIKSVSMTFVDGRDFGPFAIPDSLNKQISQRFPIELYLPENVKHSAATRSWPLQGFLSKCLIDFTLRVSLATKFKVANFGLTDTNEYDQKRCSIRLGFQREVVVTMR